jgi:polysaccharide biosynthesis/export protein
MFIKVGSYTAMFLFLAGCASYKQNIMFKTGENFVPSVIAKATEDAARNYVIQKKDLLGFSLFTNNGEKLVDPNPELSQTTQVAKPETQATVYLVDEAGIARFPLVGEIRLDGLTLKQAELVLQKEFEKFYTAAYVKMTFENKRVTVLGATGGFVLPLKNENMRLTEVLGMAKGLENNSKAHNIRVLRQEKVFVIDLSTIEGYLAGDMIIEPGDIVYVEPIRRPVTEGLKDNTFVFTLATSLLALISILTR